MRGLEHEREGTFEFLQNGLDQLSEVWALVGLRIVDVLCEDGYCFCVGFTLKLVSSLLKDQSERGRIGDNSIVDDSEVSLGIRAKRMAVNDRGRAVSRPTRVCDRDLREEVLGGVDVGFRDLLAQTGHFADLLEEEHFADLVTVNTDAGGVVATILLTSEAIDQNLADSFTILDEEVVRSRQCDIGACKTRAKLIRNERISRLVNEKMGEPTARGMNAR